MHPLTLFVVLLFLPNTGIQDWQKADAPNLHQLMAAGALGLMNARTSETDKITTLAGEQSIFAGQRMDGISKPDIYSPIVDNLEDGLENSGISVSGQIPRPTVQPPFYLPNPTPQFFAATLTGSWSNIDNQLGKYADVIRQKQGILLLVSPNPNTAEYDAKDQLTPVLLFGQGVAPGYLSSASTRTAGLITNTDIAPTIANIMGAELPQPTYGTSAVVLPSPDDAASKLAHDQDTWAIQAGLISFLPYIAGILALMILAAIFLSTSKPVWAHKIAALTAVIPLILLLSTTLPIFGVLLAVAVAIALFFLRPADTSLFAAISVAIMVVVDCFVFGGKLTSGSMLGYCPIFGARYYGLGNEIMGAYIGALVVITAIWDAPGKFRAGLILMWAVVGFSLALPIAGAKAGGLIVCAVTIAAYIACGTGRKLTDWVSIASMAAALAVAVAALIALSHFGPATHVGNTMALAKTGGMGTIFSTIGRKAGMDIHLVFHSVWVWVLALSAYGRFRLRSTGVLASVGTAATLACLFFNDAGVIAAAICSLIVWASEFNDIAGAPALKTAVPLEAAEV